ncbi:MAG: epimerase [Acidobacteria bacterium]|nr:epimerase [Acidobacteriota bacterium]
MSTKRTRREILRTTALGSVTALVASRMAFAADEKAKPGKQKNLLILGGTGFLGPHLVEAAKASGWTITLFNRGKTRPTLFPELTKLQGDRDTGDYKSLEGKKFDAVIDPSGYWPRHVRQAAAAVGNDIGLYVFISSISVYPDNSKPNMDETAAVGTISEADAEKMATKKDITESNYGPLKAACEAANTKAYGKRALNIRPGYIVGPGDGSDRFTYWPVRAAKGGEMLAPGTPKDPIQIIDVRDLAEWTIRMVDAKAAGEYNATGPKTELTMGAVLDSCKKMSKSDVTFTWVSAAVLKEQKLDPPIWAAPDGESAGFHRVSIKRALAKGLTFRPLDTTVADTLTYWNGLPEERKAKPRAFVDPAKEAEVLALVKTAKKPAA